MDNRTHRQTQLLIENHQLSNYKFNIFLKCIVYLFFLYTWTTGHTDKHNFWWTITNCPNITSIFFLNISILIWHMDNQTHWQTQPLVDNHQLSNSNLNILLKFILYLFSLYTWTTGHTDEHNFWWTIPSCPILTSIFFSNLLCIYYNWIFGQTDTQKNTNFDGQSPVVQI